MKMTAGVGYTITVLLNNKKQINFPQACLKRGLGDAQFELMYADCPYLVTRKRPRKPEGHPLVSGDADVGKPDVEEPDAEEPDAAVGPLPLLNAYVPDDADVRAHLGDAKEEVSPCPLSLRGLACGDAAGHRCCRLHCRPCHAHRRQRLLTANALPPPGG